MDDLLCALLVYMPLTSFVGPRPMSQIASQIIAAPLIPPYDFIAPETKKLAQLLLRSRRYRKLHISHFVNRVDEQMQFGAMTARLGKITVVSFKGSNRTLISWWENFRMFYQYPTVTQKEACTYLQRRITIFDRHVRVVGHSKGGNLALVSCMHLPQHQQHRIQAIASYDGPGVRQEQYRSRAYKRLLPRLTNYLPCRSYVGCLLYNDHYRYVATSAFPFNQHFPTTWEVFGQYLVPGKLHTLSDKLHKQTTDKLSSLDDVKLAEAIESTFAALEYGADGELDFSLHNFLHVYQNLKNIDPAIKQYVRSVITSVMHLQNLREKGGC